MFDEESPKSKTYSFSHRGVDLLVFGAIHGDEVCGSLAIEKIMRRLDSGDLTLHAGSITFVPICNPRAYAKNVRQTEENLNRVFKKTEHPTSYEARLANKLCLLADKADFLLDIHSSSAPAPANVFIDYPSAKSTALAQALVAEFHIYDWSKVYKDNAHLFSSYSTDEYMHSIGKEGMTLECGQHNDSKSIDVAIRGILGMLMYFKMIDQVIELSAPINTHRVHMRNVFVKTSEKDVFLGNWNHLQIVPSGTCIAQRSSGERICVEEESVVIFPAAQAPVGEEWFYLGEERA